MRSKAYQSFLEEEVLSASPVELVQLLYRGALDAIASARRHLRQGEIRARSRAITKAMAIVTELSSSLDREAGGDLSRNLERIYGYVERLMIEANTRQQEASLITAERLLTTLLEGWQSLPQETPAQYIPEELSAPDGNTDRRVRCAY